MRWSSCHRRFALPLAAIAGIAIVQPALAQSAPTDHEAAGQDHFFNHEFSLAAQSFRRLTDERPADPSARVQYSKALLYLELDRLEMVNTSAFRGDPEYADFEKPEPDREAKAGILAAIREGQDLCRSLMDADPDDARAINALAQLHALRANYELMIEKAYFKALSNGRKGRALSYRVGELEPDFPDGLLVAGLDEYIVGSLPWAVRAVLALSGYRGRKKVGASLIARVATEGTENRNDARLLLAMLQQRERRPIDAAGTYLELARDFPRAFTYVLEAAAMYAAKGDGRRALKLFREAERKRTSGEDRFDRMPERIASALARRIESLERELAKKARGPAADGGASQDREATSLLNSARRSSFAAAAPESTESAAMAAAPDQLEARPAIRRAAAALASTMSRGAPRSPARTDRTKAAFVAASPPAICEASAVESPKSAGSTRRSRTAPSRTSAIRVGPAKVISSMPSHPWTTRARCAPSRRSASAAIDTMPSS